MIRELFIKNIAVIENLNIDFKAGMSALTGETGAGKSIIIDSINMILGNKADKSLIRYGEEKASVQAIFDVDKGVEAELSEQGIECEEGELIISRTLSSEGKSVCRINGLVVPLSLLREISSYLINIQGQHDNQALLTSQKHILFLDAYAGTEDVFLEYKNLYTSLRDAEHRISELFMDDEERLRRVDLLEYQVSEIEEAALKENEEEELKEERDRIENAEKIAASVEEAKNSLYSDEGISAYDGIYKAMKALERISGIDSEIDKAYSSLCDMVYSVQDIAHEITEFAENVEYDEERLNEIEERLGVYSKLKRKYGKTVEEINEFYENISEELKTLQSVDENIEKVKSEISEITKKITACAEKLSKIRKAAASSLQEKIETALHELNMEQAHFTVLVEELEEFAPSGKDRIEFLISANAGEPEKPLVKIASGGELSRVMLAIKSILAECDGVDTLIFDEIDTGVSGSAAQKIADKLAKISNFRQVICITHLPQLAAMADNHYYIEKNVEDCKTKTTVYLLEGNERVEEVARITGGELTEISRKHAKELIEKASDRKCRQRGE